MRRDGAANRERILQAAEEVFGAGGATASTEEIAARAEVGIATVFRHFPSKQDLLEATAVRHLERMEAEAREAAGLPDPGQALAQLMRALVSTSAAKFALANMLKAGGRGITEPIVAASTSFQEAVRAVVQRAQAAGDAHADATVDDVFLLTQALAQVGAPEQDIDRALTIVLRGLGVEAV